MKVPRVVQLGLLAVALATAGACTENNPNMLTGVGNGGECTGMKTSSGTGKTSAASSGGKTGATTGVTTGGGTGGSGGIGGASAVAALDARVLDYNEALRTASLKLVGNLPTVQETLDLKAASSPAVAYAALIDQMIASPAFAARMVAYFQNTFRQGNTAAVSTPDRNAAPTFAARLVVEGGNFMNLFTATTNTCPTFDGMAFHDGSCDNGPITAGVLTDPGIQFQYFSDMAMRRDRFFQEVFSCAPSPSQFGANPVKMGNGTYTGAYPFASIAGTENPDNGGRVDFHDTTSVVCANCHAEKNHRAPLFANFDSNGKYQSTISVFTPIPCPTGDMTCQNGVPFSLMTDWLPTGESTAWKSGQPVSDLAGFGAAMAADTTVQYCAVARMWNYVMSKGDIVNDGADLPPDVIAEYIAQFTSNSFNLRDVLKSMLVGPDFVRF